MSDDSQSRTTKLGIGFLAGEEPAQAPSSDRPETTVKPTTHELKTWPEFFQSIADEEKTFEIRRDDRGFRVGDYLLLREWTHDDGYSGRVRLRKVCYVLRDFPGLAEGWVCMGLRHG